jgi:hypothetical protein
MEQASETLRRKVTAMNLERVGPFEESPAMRRLGEISRSTSWAKGWLQGFKLGLFKVIAHVGLTLSEEERARIDACDDPAVLDRWLDNAYEAKTAANLFQ